LSLGAVPTDFTFTNKRRHRGERERERGREGESRSEWCGEASGVEECQKKKEVTTPPQLSFLSPVCFLPLFLVLAQKRKKRKKRGLLKIN